MTSALSATRATIAHNLLKTTPNVEEAFNDPNANYIALKEVFEQMLKEWKEDQPIRLEDDCLTIAFSHSTSILSGPALRALCDCLKQYPSIHTLILQRCDFRESSWEDLLHAFIPAANLRHLFLNENPLDEIKFVKLTSLQWLMQDLQSFYYQENPFHIVEDIYGICELVKNASKLQDLAVDGCELTDPMVSKLSQALSSGTQLSRLSLRRNRITDEGANHLALFLDRNRSLRNLDFSENRLKYTALQGLAKALEKHPVPLQIQLKANSDELIEVGVNALFDRVPQLEGLDVSNHPKLSASIVIKNALKRAHNLTQLNLKATKLTDAEVKIMLTGKRQRTESDPPIHVYVQVDSLCEGNRKALQAYDLGAIFHLYVQRNLLGEINAAQISTQELLSKAQQLPEQTEPEMAAKSRCFYALLSKAFDVVDIPKDGNCLFHCFALALQTSKPAISLDQESLREQTVEYMLGHSQEFLDFFAPESGEGVSRLDLLKKHCGEMYVNNTWAGQTEIKAVYEWLKSKGIPRSIVLFHMHSLALDGQSFRAHLTWGDQSTEEPIYLFFENKSHYTLLRKHSSR